MILVRFSQVIRDVTVEIEGEDDTLSQILDAWGSFQDAIQEVEGKPGYQPLPGAAPIVEVL